MQLQSERLDNKVVVTLPDEITIYTVSGLSDHTDLAFNGYSAGMCGFDYFSGIGDVFVQ